MRTTIAWLFAALLWGLSTDVLACSRPTTATEDAIIFSSIPSESVPAGAVQLLVALPKDLDSAVGILTLPVKDVINGTYGEKTIHLNVGNVDRCGTTFQGWRRLGGADGYVTVLSMLYSDGTPVTDARGRQVYGAQPYRDFAPGFFASAQELPKFTTYAQNPNLWFSNEQIEYCLHKGDYTEDAWRQCVKPGEPVSLVCERNKLGALVCEEGDWPKGRPRDLMRGYSLWDEYRLTIILGLLGVFTLLGAASFVRSAKVKNGQS